MAVTKISFSSSLPQARKGKSQLSLFASKAAIKKGLWKKVFTGKLSALGQAMAADANPGGMGKVLSSYTGTAPQKLTLGVLPDKVSRHSSWATPLQECFAKADLSSNGSSGVVIQLDEIQQLTAGGGT